jgi:hypothetical protein
MVQNTENPSQKEVLKFFWQQFILSESCQKKKGVKAESLA